jgi:hypothetical protein
MPKHLSLLSILAAPVVLALSQACEPQVSPAYKGQALLTIGGSVEVDSQRERGRLLPALAFYNSETSLFHIVDVEVEGEFPSDFTLRVYEPPPGEAIVTGPDRPASAVGYITAVTEGHPDSVLDPVSSGAGSSCTPARAGEVSQCVHYQDWCTADRSECYSEERACPAFDSPLEECEILSSSGDPGLRIDPWEKFAGLSELYRILYLEQALDADDPAALAVGLPTLGAGYHLFEVRPFDEAEQLANDACREQAGALAVERYNEAHDTDYEPELFFGSFGCSVPDEADPPGEQGAAPAGRIPSDSCATSPPADAYDAIDELALSARIDLGCSPADATLRLVEHPEQERISVRIAADVRPTF